MQKKKKELLTTVSPLRWDIIRNKVCKETQESSKSESL